MHVHPLADQSPYPSTARPASPLPHGITDSASAAQRRVFWENVDASLLKLKLPTAERQRLEAAIAVKVPRPRQRIPLEEPLPQPRPITKRR